MGIGYHYVAPHYRKIEFNSEDLEGEVKRGDIVPVPNDHKVLSTFPHI